MPIRPLQPLELQVFILGNKYTCIQVGNQYFQLLNLALSNHFSAKIKCKKDKNPEKNEKKSTEPKLKTGIELYKKKLRSASGILKNNGKKIRKKNIKKIRKKKN